MSSLTSSCLTGAIVLLLSVSPALPEPYIAARDGYKCSACHVNQIGGGKRTDFGALFTQTDISPLISGASDRAMDFSPLLGNGISLGADFAVAHETLLAVNEKLVRDAGVLTYEQDTQNSFGVSSGNLYLEAQLVPEQVALYLDETVAPAGAASREAFVLVQSLPMGAYFKAGRMLLPYGIRLVDDEAFVRQATGFNFDNQDLGVQLGFEPGKLALVAALSNGTQGGRDDNNGKQVSSSGSLYLDNSMVGGSFSWNKSRGIERILFGPYGSVNLGPLTLMGEADWIRESGATDQDQFILFTSLEYWCRQSVNVRVAFDYLDPYDRVEEDERSRLSLAVHAFLTPSLEASATYRLRASIPQDVQGNADGLTLGLHSFF